MKLYSLTFSVLCLFISLGSFAQDMDVPVEAKPEAVIEFENHEFDFGTIESEVEFNSKGKQGKQSKRVTLTTNADPAQTFLTVRGEVLKSNDEAPSVEDMEMAEERTKAKEEMEALNPDCFAIYPNPTNETLQLRLKEHIGKSAVVDIHNDMGQKIMDTEIDRISSESTRFDVSSFTPGIYMITIRIDAMKPLTQCFVVTGK